MSSLCDSCTASGLAILDFADFEVGSKAPENRMIKQQSLGALKATTACSLCQLIAFAVEDIRKEWAQAPRSDDAVLCRVYIMLYRFPTPKPFSIIDVETLDLPFHGPSYGIQLLPVGSDSQGSLVGRRLDSKVSLNRIRNWIQRCVERHGDSCGLSKSSRFVEIEELMMVVDVESGNIVRPSGEFQYLALSYVWGDLKDPVKLLKENISDFQSPGGIAKIFKSLPSTIRDAIKLTRELGYKYLWIDSLCIIQDDSDFKTRIIHKMNLVYENAFITIIAASGSDANAGLPGAGESARNFIQPTAAVNGKLNIIYARSHQNLAKSKWATRGWTYQEYYFSKRRLIFHDGLVFFHCRERTWREDVAMEEFDHEPRQFDLKVGFDGSGQFWEPGEEDSSFFAAYYSFWRSVYAYKTRRLSYESDALQAFAGIVDHFQINKGMEIFWGLPLPTFPSDLFWQPDLFAARRDGFPTWSWVGWTGDLASSRFDSEEHRVLSSWISVYRQSREGACTVHFSPVHVDKEILGVDPHSLEGNQEECSKSALQSLGKIVSVLQQIHNDMIKAENFWEIPDIKGSISALKKLAHTRFEIYQTLAAYSLSPDLQAQAIFFRALTAEVWISACAPNGEVVVVKKRVDWLPEAQYLPTLYMYSTKEPTLKPVGLAWIQESSAYLKIVALATQAAPTKFRSDMKPGRTGELRVTADPRKMFFKNEDSSSSTENMKPRSEKEQRKMDEVKKLLETIGREEQYPYDSISCLPSEPYELNEILCSRRIRKLRIALISGPVKGVGSGRKGVPFGYHLDSRRFFRAIVLADTFIKHPNPQYSERMMCYSHRLGVAEFEIDALPLLENVQFQDVVLL